MASIKSGVKNILRLDYQLKSIVAQDPFKPSVCHCEHASYSEARVARSTHLPWLVWPSGLSWIPVVSLRKSICPTAVNILIRDVILVKLGFNICSYCLFTPFFFRFCGRKERQINIGRARRYKSGQTAVWRIDLRAKRPLKSIGGSLSCFERFFFGCDGSFHSSLRC